MSEPSDNDALDALRRRSMGPTKSAGDGVPVSNDAASRPLGSPGFSGPIPSVSPGTPPPTTPPTPPAGEPGQPGRPATAPSRPTGLGGANPETAPVLAPELPASQALPETQPSQPMPPGQQGGEPRVSVRLGWEFHEKPPAPSPPMGSDSAPSPGAIPGVDTSFDPTLLETDVVERKQILRNASTTAYAATGAGAFAVLFALVGGGPVLGGIAAVVCAVAGVAWLVALARTARSGRLHLMNPTAVGGLGLVGGGIAGGAAVLGPIGAIGGVALAAAAVRSAKTSANHLKGEDRVVSDRVASQVRHVEEASRRQVLMHTEKEQKRELSKVQYESQVEQWRESKSWYPVRTNRGASRLDVVGGTPIGWSAMLLTTCGDLLDAGGRVTVIDLTELAIGHELVDVARSMAGPVEMYSLPDDIESIDLGDSLDRAALIDILTNVVHDADANAKREEWAANAAIIERIVDTLAHRATPARVIAGLRVILREEAPPRDDSGLLTFDEYEQLSSLYGDKVRSAGVDSRALALLNQLQGLSKLGTLPREVSDARLRVLALNPTGTDLQNAVLGDFMVHACIRQLRTGGFDTDWKSSIVVVGAERLSNRNLEQISSYADRQGVGLVLMFRKFSDEVNSFIGSGDSAIAFMRMGNAKEAKMASEQIGTSWKFVMSQLTENVSTSITDTSGTSYGITDGTNSSSSWGSSDNYSKSDNTNLGTGVVAPTAQGGSKGTSDSFGTSKNFSTGISVSTNWGENTSRAIGDTTGESRTLQRSRENLVEIHELQQLPKTAFILVEMTGEGDAPRVVLGDANPAIHLLPDASPEAIAQARAQAQPSNNALGTGAANPGVWLPVTDVVTDNVTGDGGNGN